MVFREVHNLTNYEVENFTQGQRYRLLIDTHTHTHKHNIIPIAVNTYILRKGTNGLLDHPAFSMQ